MKNKIIQAISVTSIFLLLILTACSSNHIPERSNQDNAYTHIASTDQFTSGEAELGKLEAITQRYLTSGSDIGIGALDINLLLAFDISSEGASFFTIHDDSNNLEYLSVDIFGEMGRVTHSYTFTEHFIVYSIVEILYSEPFYINPTNVPISAVINSRFIIFNGNVYRFVDEDEYTVIHDELRDSIIKGLLNFLERLP